MALATRNLAVLTDEGLTALVELDYDNAVLRLVTARVINPTARAMTVIGVVSKNGRSFSRTFAAGQTSTQAIPQGAGGRLEITIDGRGRLDGIDYQIAWAA